MLKKCILIIIVSICCVFSISTFANTLQKTEIISNKIAELKNIQKQVITLSSNIYVNKKNSKSNDDILNILKVYKDQLSSISKELLNIKEDTNIADYEKSNIATLNAVSNYLNYLIDNIIKYSNSTDAYEEFQLLSNHF